MRRKFGKAALILGVNYVLLEILCIGVLGFYRFIRSSYAYRPIDALTLSSRQMSAIKRISDDKLGYIRFDRTLGWPIRGDSISADGIYTSNSDGIRGDKNYSLNIPDRKTRITTFGDSFTHGDQVSNKDTWQSLMESKASNLEVLNFGVGGYGLDQAYLRFLEHGSKYETDIVIIGFMTENINRNRNRFRPFYFKRTGLPFSKPMFTYINGSLSLIPSYFRKPQDYNELFTNRKTTIQRLGEGDFYYQRGLKSNPYLDWSPAIRLTKVFLSKYFSNLGNPYLNDPNTLEVTKALFKSFRDKVSSYGQRPIVVIFPNKQDITRCNESKEKRYKPLIDYLRSNNFDFIDLGGQLCNYKPAEVFNGHYNRLGNKIVAETMLRHVSR